MAKIGGGGDDNDAFVRVYSLIIGVQNTREIGL